MPGVLQHGERMVEFVAVGVGIVLTRFLWGTALGDHLGTELRLDATPTREEIRANLHDGRQGAPRGPGRQGFSSATIQITLQNQAVTRGFLNLPALGDSRAQCRAAHLLDIAPGKEQAGFIGVRYG